MRPAPFIRLPTSRIALLVYGAIALASITVVSAYHKKPRPWPIAEVPIAFWAWRTQSPDQVDVSEAIEKARARSIFLRAGQFEYHDGKLSRIRPLRGSLPQGIELHLVYNATAALLDQFENVDPKALATAIGLTYREDLDRARQDGANVSGLQLDIDVPTRLLSRYEKTLHALRRALQQGNQLSITGLPTWMESAELDNVLKHVDFWVPQFYGTEIPQRSDQIIPISSPQHLTHFVNRAREVDKPFYAGLPAYSFALLYSPSGALISLRGDMDLASIASDPNLELIDQRTFDTPASNSASRDQATNEWRYAFRARSDGVTDGLAMHAGDLLVVDVPSTESLRIAARNVRKLAGKRLLGICIFRLPSREDPTTLTTAQVNSALTDQDSATLIDVRIKRQTPANNSQAGSGKWVFEFQNGGTTSALVGTLKIDLAVRPGSFEAMTSDTRVAIETMCEGNAGLSTRVPQPCSQRRASLIRLTAPALAPGRTFKVILALNREPPATIPVSITMQTDTGQSYSVQRQVSVDTGVNR